MHSITSSECSAISPEARGLRPILERVDEIHQTDTARVHRQWLTELYGWLFGTTGHGAFTFSGRRSASAQRYWVGRAHERIAAEQVGTGNRILFINEHRTLSTVNLHARQLGIPNVKTAGQRHLCPAHKLEKSR